MRSRHGRRGAGTDFIATDDPYQRAELMAGHLHRLEAALDRTRAAVVSLRQLLRPDAVTLDVANIQVVRAGIPRGGIA